MNWIISSLVVALLLSCSQLPKSSPKYQKLDENFNLITEFDKAKGSVVIQDTDKIVYERNFGNKNVDEPIYRIGSISKTYTAVIVLKLVEEQKLSLLTKLSEFYPKIHRSREITIEHLLRHRSGLPNMTSQDDYINYFFSDQNEADQIKRFKSYKLEFSPGEKFSYSNTGYVLLTYIAQKASGLDFSTLLEKYITKPLKLKNTFVYNSQIPREYEVKSYEKGFEWRLSSNTHENVPLGAGAIASTAREVAIFLRALLRGQLISQENLDKLSDISGGYGLGVFDFPYNEKKFLGHTGGIDGFRSIAGYHKEDDVTFVLLTNAMAMNMNDISIATLASYYGDSFELPKFTKAIKVSNTVLDSYVGTYSGTEFPLKLSFRYEEGVLFGKASGPGQSEIQFEASSPTDFSYPGASITLRFSRDGSSVEFTQGKTFQLKKESP